MSHHNAQDAQPSALSPQSLRLEDLARVLSASGPRPVTVDMLRADIANGAPTNADATMSLLQYWSWLLKETAVARD